MVADTALTGSALIKALKAPKESPQQPKIDLAIEAWSDKSLHIPRKAEVLADWVLEAWGRAKPNENSPLLNPKYHRLLVDVYPSCPVAPSAQISILAAYVQAAAKAGPAGTSEELGEVVETSFPLLLRGQKAEAWAEQWGKLVDVLAKKDVPVGALWPVAELVCGQLAASLSSTPNAKKVRVAKLSSQSSSANLRLRTLCIPISRRTLRLSTITNRYGRRSKLLHPHCSSLFLCSRPSSP